MTKMRLIKMISDLSFCIGRLEGYHEGMIMTNQKLNGMDMLLDVAHVMNESVNVLEDWFKEQYPE